MSTTRQTLLKKEIENFPKFVHTGHVHGQKIAYRILHEVLPAMVNHNLRKVGDLIFDYRFKMGSISNCSFVYPRIIEIAKKLAFLKEENLVKVLSISSVGPAFFSLTDNRNIGICRETFKKQGLKVIETKIENGTYKVK